MDENEKTKSTNKICKYILWTLAAIAILLIISGISDILYQAIAEGNQ